MKKLISFRQLKSNCAWEIIQNRGTMYDCGYLSSERAKCTAKNCPVWKNLEEPPDRYVDGKPYEEKIKALEAEVERLRCCQNCKYITSKGECVHGLNEWNETLCGHYETDALTSEDRK